MMKLKRFLKSSAKIALSSSLLVSFALFSGCSSSTKATFLKEQIPQAIQDICKKEYNLDVKSRLVGETLWVYLPVEDLLKKEPEKFVDKFEVYVYEPILKDAVMGVKYNIKPIKDRSKTQEYKYNKEAFDRVNDAWQVIRRVLFSMERSSGGEPEFIWVVIADTKNVYTMLGVDFGIELQQITYFKDMKKVFYGFIPITEFQHRSIHDTVYVPKEQIIRDFDGNHLKYRDIGMAEFILRQIKQRIELKFQKPEVEKDVDIDKEILKVATYTINIYNFRDFDELQLINALTNNSVLLNRLAVIEKPIEKRF